MSPTSDTALSRQRKAERLLLKKSFHLENGLTTLKDLSMQKDASGYSAPTLGKYARRLGIRVRRGAPSTSPLASLRVDLATVRRVNRRIDRAMRCLKG